MGLYDRDYFRNSKPQTNNFLKIPDNAVGKLVFINVATYILTLLIDAIFGYGTASTFFDYSPKAILEGRVWTIFSYSFLHGGIFHLLLNMLGLYFAGRFVESWIGSKKFYMTYFTGVLFGAIVWTPFALSGNEVLIGASAGVIAIFTTFCLMYPPHPVTFLLLVFPVSMKPMTMLKIAIAIETFGLLTQLSGRGTNIAYAAHLGGILAGFLIVKLQKSGKLNLKTSSIFKQKQYFRKSAKDYKFSVNIGGTEDEKSEIDRILDKINNQGFSSLTDEERDFLRKSRK